MLDILKHLRWLCLLIIPLNSYAAIIVQPVNVALNVAASCSVTGIPNFVTLELVPKVAVTSTLVFNINCNMDDPVAFSITSNQYKDGFFLQKASGGDMVFFQFFINSQAITNNTMILNPNVAQDLLIKTYPVPQSISGGIYTGTYSLIVSY